MDIAIVTGAERGVGLRISQKLVALGLKVYGLAQDVSKCHFQHQDFIPIACDLTRVDQLESAWKQITDRDPQIYCVVHAVRHAPESAFEATSTEELAYAVQTNLLCPVLLTRLALPSLIRLHGYVINLAWQPMGEAPGGPIGAASLGGLFHFGQALFDDIRDTGVKVCTLYPQTNSGERDPKGRLRLQPQSEIDPECVAEAVETVIRFKGNNAISQVVLRPQATREDPIVTTSVPELVHAKHDVQLPPPGKQKEVEDVLIPTPEPKRPEDAPPPEADDDEADEEDDELDLMMQESRDLLRKQRELAKKKVNKQKARHETEPRHKEAIPIQAPEPEKPETLTEEEKAAAEDARRRFAAMLGMEADAAALPSQVVTATDEAQTDTDTNDNAVETDAYGNDANDAITDSASSATTDSANDASAEKVTEAASEDSLEPTQADSETNASEPQPKKKAAKKKRARKKAKRAKKATHAKDDQDAD